MTEKEQFDAAREFARRVVQAMWDGGDVYGGDVQDWAQELGLISGRTATAADVDDFTSFGAGEEMFEFQEWMQKPTPDDGLPYK